MNKSILIDFSGWVKVDPDSIEFEYVGEDDRPIIKGSEWINLNHEQKKWYIISSVIEAQIAALDGEYDNIELGIEDEEDE